MNNFEETVQNIDGFCKVLVKRSPENAENKIIVGSIEKSLLPKSTADEPSVTTSNGPFISLPQIQEPLIDVFEEENYLRILVQCRCREQQVTLYLRTDSIRICREECHLDASGTVVCVDNCQKINLLTDHFQLENRLFVVAKCNNNEVLEAIIPKKKLQ